MKDQKKAEEIATQRMQLLSPLLAEGLDNAQARQIKAMLKAFLIGKDELTCYDEKDEDEGFPVLPGKSLLPTYRISS